MVGTPIGNLGDLSPRAAETLGSADLVVAEDTRVAARLLSHVGARPPTMSFNEHNVARRLPELLGRLDGGALLALTTDAGMPGVSDPGGQLVAAAREAGHVVEVVPGPAAVTAAMALSGLEAAGFVFGGFLPARPVAARRAMLERMLAAAAGLALPLILYEAPHRIRALLSELDASTPMGTVAVCRELTKRHEEVLVGSPRSVATRLGEVRGEFTVVVSGLEFAAAPADGMELGSLAAAAAAQGLGRRSIAELLRAAGLNRRRAYELAGEALGKGPLSER